MAKKPFETNPPEVHAIRALLKKHFNTPYNHDSKCRRVGNAKFGIYAFFDFEDEPIYVGRTYGTLRARIGRHLTNQRTDAVAMNVLDPFEVLKMRLWPLFELEDLVDGQPARSQERKRELDAAKAVLTTAEYMVFNELVDASKFKAMLNEKDIPTASLQAMQKTTLPVFIDFQIVPDEVYEARKHPDLRIARRTATISRLAQVISEREASKGLRRTLVTQARRLLSLAESRFDTTPGNIPFESGNKDSD